MPQFDEITLGVVTRGRKSSAIIVALSFMVHFLLLDDSHGEFRGGILSVIAMPFWQALPTVGWRLFHASIMAMAALVFFIYLHRLTGQRWMGVVGALVLTMNPLVLAAAYPSEGSVVLLAATGVLAASIARPGRPFVVGLLSGLCLAVAPCTLPLMPVLIGVGLLGPRVTGEASLSVRATLLSSLWSLLGLLLVAVPALAVRFGLLAPPANLADEFMGGFGLLSGKCLTLAFASFADNWLPVRALGDAFPQFLMVPLVVVRSMGVLLTVIGVMGVGAAWRKMRRFSFVMLAWFAVGYLVLVSTNGFGFGEMSGLMVLVPPMTFFVVMGLDRFSQVGSLKGNVVVLLLSAVALVVALKITYYLDFDAAVRQPAIELAEKSCYSTERMGFGQAGAELCAELPESSGVEVSVAQDLGDPRGVADAVEKECHLKAKGVLTRGNLLPSLYLVPEGTGARVMRSLRGEWE